MLQRTNIINITHWVKYTPGTLYLSIVYYISEENFKSYYRTGRNEVESEPMFHLFILKWLKLLEIGF